MTKPNIRKLDNIIKNAKITITKHSPEILTGIGITGLLTTTVLAVKATPKALKLIEENKKEKAVDELTPKEVIQATWKCYIPAAVTAAASTACIIGASSVNLRRNAALAAAYKLSETALTEYKEKVVETFGEKKEKLVREGLAKDRIDKNPVRSSEVIVTSKGETLCLDYTSGRYFKSDIESIKKAVNELNRRMLSENYISLNEFYEEIDLPPIKLGYDIGWNVDRGFIDVSFDAALDAEGRPCIVVSFVTDPRYGFSSLY